MLILDQAKAHTFYMQAATGGIAAAMGFVAKKIEQPVFAGATRTLCKVMPDCLSSEIWDAFISRRKRPKRRRVKTKCV